MVVNRTVLWLVLACSCVPSVGVLLRARLREHRLGTRSWAAACVDGLMTGLAVGLSLACGVLALGMLSEQAIGW